MDLFQAVREAHEEHLVPGVAVGLLANGEERREAFGVTSTGDVVWLRVSGRLYKKAPA